MRTTGRANREHVTAFKKRETSSDPYARRGAMAKAAVCGGCHAVYRNKRWYADEPLSITMLNDPATTRTVCPACLRIRDDFPGGIVTMKGDYVLPHKQDLLNLIRNEEHRARSVNPLERVMSIRENGEGSIIVSTTNERLAQKLGRAMKKAFHGEVVYRWSHDNKLVRVDWLRTAA